MPPVIPRSNLCIVPCHLQLIKSSRMPCHSLALQHEQLYYSPFPFIVNFSIPEFFSMVFMITRSNIVSRCLQLTIWNDAECKFGFNFISLVSWSNIQSLVICSSPFKMTLSVNLGLCSFISLVSLASILEYLSTKISWRRATTLQHLPTSLLSLNTLLLTFLNVLPLLQLHYSFSS